MEPVLIIEVRAPVASFRRPLDHNYQRTLMMPPPTTLLGLAAAALGLSPEALWAPHSPLSTVRTAVWINTEPGRARDMWTLLKVKANKLIRSPYMRELLFDAHYTLFYGGPPAQLHHLAEAFRKPAYPLSLGREDELLTILDLRIESLPPAEPIFYGTIIPGDLRKETFIPELKPGILIEPPTVEILPQRFSIDQWKLRNPEQLTAFSFLPLHYRVRVPSLSALQWKQRSFTWLNNTIGSR